MNFNFPNTEAISGVGDAVTFPAYIDDKKIICFISGEALVDNFGALGVEPIEAFQANRARIESIATRLILQRRFEKDGSIYIISSDGS